MKRWTTSENLSSNEFNNGSQDSGIQSVGGSIRGSRDSVKIKSDDESALFSSIIQKVFGGKIQTSFDCENCSGVSSHQETFFELNLAVPSSNTEKDLSVQSLIDEYVEPEKLIADNQYYCDPCGSLQNALKRTKFLQSPSHLMCNLMRFRYDKDLKRRVKILTDLKHDREISIPIDKELIRFKLYGIIIHSGYSTDSGHYYTYIRDESSSSDDWFKFDDSTVSRSNFNEFNSKKSPSATAYVLLYQRCSVMNEVNDDIEEEEESFELRSDLQACVDKDNRKFIHEKETFKYANIFSNNSKKFDKDDDDPKGGGGGGGSTNGCNMGGQNFAGNRFIC